MHPVARDVGPHGVRRTHARQRLPVPLPDALDAAEARAENVAQPLELPVILLSRKRRGGAAPDLLGRLRGRLLRGAVGAGRLEPPAGQEHPRAGQLAAQRERGRVGRLRL